MLQRWKLILSNWINCYFNESSKHEKIVNIESLLNIISHLRENLNLDESKSSLLEAHTVEEFLRDKYPQFIFDNGTFEARTEEDLCLSASLLLFFVCVNSKNLDMKNAMCNKLNSEDQETILKFSKCLMQCPVITVGEVQSAITEACGQDVAASALPCRTSVMETPPIMRSLHSEVRRLQAALDAERFDRNYLQEELSRTNCRLERLLKEKEQHKLEILNLKGKISLCCGEHSDNKDAEAASDKSGKLAKQLQHLEARLEEIEGQLADAQCERDAYKSKMDELKHERDKWLSLSQQENARVSQLSDELDAERRNVQSLKDLVAELQQHNKLNGLDTSSLECDDPDASIHSLQHNSTVCSEVCVNVVEVQLGEERAKSVLLKQQVQTLQDQIVELNKRAESRKQTLENVVAQKENDIFSLKHRIKEEIEEKNNLKSHFGNEMTKLNNEINELEQKLKDNNEYSRSIIEKKMAEIQTLQEEKLLLLHSLNDETTKLNEIIKVLKSELDSEKQARASMKESYENHIMKLNEKVLNRNNELVELQNRIFEKGEQIETLQVELRCAKDACIELKNEYQDLDEQKNAIETELRHKLDEVQNLHVEMQQQSTQIEDMSVEFHELKALASSLNDDCKTLENVKEQLINEIRSRDSKIKETLKNTNHMNDEFQNEKKKLLEDMDERNATVNSLQTQLQNEIQFKIQLQDELTQLQCVKSTLSEEYEKLNSQFSKLRLDIEEKDKTVNAMDLYIEEAMKRNEQNNEKIQNLTHYIHDKEKDIKILTEKLESTTKSLQDDIQKNVHSTEVLRIKLLDETGEREALQLQYKSLLKEKSQVEKDLSVKCEEILMLRDEFEELSQKLDENESRCLKQESNFNKEIDKLNGTIELLQEGLKNEKDVAMNLNIEKSALNEKLDNLKSLNNNMVEEIQSIVNERHELNKELVKANSSIQTLNTEKESMEICLRYEKSTHDKIYSEKNILIDTLQIEIQRKDEKIKIALNKYEELKERFEENKLLLEDLASEKNRNVEKNRRLLEELKSLEDVLEKHRQVQDNLVKEKSIQQEQYDRLLEDYEKLNKTFEDSEKETSDLMKEIEYEREKNKGFLKDLLELTQKLEYKEIECSTILDEYEKFKTKFEESKQTHETVLQEKECLLLHIKTKLEVLMAEKESLDKALNAEKAVRDQIQSEKNALAIKFELDSIDKLEDKKTLLQEIEKLKGNLVAVKAAQNILNEEKEIIIAEKDALVSSLSIEKCARDEIETEKNNLRLMLEDLSSNHQHIVETNTKIAVAMSEGLVKLAHKVRGRDLSNKMLQKLTNDNDFKDMPINESYTLIFNIADDLAATVSDLQKLKVEQTKYYMDLNTLQESLRQKENKIIELENDIKQLQQVENEHRIEQAKQSETYGTSMNSKIKDIRTLQQENQTLHNELNDVKVQLEVKVHSLTEKLNENENLTDKLKQNYECQISNLNVMITKLSNYLKDKTVELEALRKDKEALQQTVADSKKVIETLEHEVKIEKQNIDKLISEFDSERQVLKNMVSVTESVMEDEKIRLNNIITEYLLVKDSLEVENKRLKSVTTDLGNKFQTQQTVNASLLSLLRLERNLKTEVEKESEIIRDYFDELIHYLSKERNTNLSVISALEFQEKVLVEDYEKIKNDNDNIQKVNHVLKIAAIELENELKIQKDKLEIVLQEKSYTQNELTKILEEKSQLQKALQEKSQTLTVVQIEIKELKNEVIDLGHIKTSLELEKRENIHKINELTSKIDSIVSKNNEEIGKLKTEIQQLQQTIEENKLVITNLEKHVEHNLEENSKLRNDHEREKVSVINKCSLLQSEAENQLAENLKEIASLKMEVESLKSQIELSQQDSIEKDGRISKVSKEKDAVISTISNELSEEKAMREKCENELESRKHFVPDSNNDMEFRVLRKENEQLIRAIGQRELLSQKAKKKHICQVENNDHHQVDNSSSDNMHSSAESLKTITDLEIIIQDRNRTITSLQTDITYLKSIVADSETSLLDVKKELEVNKENCQQLSVQLKKIVHQKNEEIADLKRQVAKLSAAENRATQIIKVSAKYQAMIFKRIAEIKSNTILKELTNFGNSNDNELRRSLNAGSITMEDLEVFLETTDRHLKRCSDKQIALQKERDRLIEVHKINESENINLKKFLSELSVSFNTFSTVKDLYGQKLSRVVSVQRTVRREILNLDGRIADGVMCKLERGYGAAMQDLSECALNFERWFERCISRTVSVEKIKQAFTSDSERSALSSPSFQNTGLEIQLGELEKSFQKLLEEVARAVKGEVEIETQSSTIMEVRAEYEDKLNRMKAKMKDLFNEQMAVLKNKQREEVEVLERELHKTRDRMEEMKRAYESHIKDLTKELWNVGEKYLVKNDEAEWLRKKQRSGSLMSLQHVHSSGLAPPPEPPSRPSDAYSLRSLPVVTENTKNNREGRGLHMSDEEGEVFDNRWLKELASTPRREPAPGQRLSELKWRNSLCPPHLKSSYPAETQFAPILDEDEIKAGATGPARSQRKEVGITAYKKPGPPTPSKQAGRLSATDSELRESLRVENDPHAHADRKTGTPSRLRSFLRFNKNDTNEGTPRARRLSNIFRKK